MDLGLLEAGIDILQSLDLDKKATACMTQNQQYFKHAILTEDIKDKLVLKQVGTDIMVFTYPCTKYSSIADIRGTRTGDDLFLHGLRHLAIERPEMYIVENVPGMKKFQVVMEAMTKMPDYYVNVICPVDAACWLPQKRERLIIIGTRKPFSIQAPGKSNKARKLKDIVESDPEIDFPDYVINRLNGKYRDMPIIVDPEDINAMAPTCVAHYAKDLGTRLVKDRKSMYGVRPFTIREYARLQGFPDGFFFEDERASYRLIGNAVAVDVGRWAGEQAMRYFN